MSGEGIQDFETENIIARYKFRLASWTIEQYGSFAQILNYQKQCLQIKCLDQQSLLTDLDQFQRCVQNCETGSREVISMQHKHAEVQRLTYSKNLQKCEQIHGSPTNENYESGDLNATALAHCISHNTDKVDRRFFGYYGSQRQNLTAKYAFP